MADKYEQFGYDLDAALGDLTLLEKALILAKAFREELGGEWDIIAKPDGGFVIERKKSG